MSGPLHTHSPLMMYTRYIHTTHPQVTFLEKMLRDWEEEVYQDQAYAIHHYQNETGINRWGVGVQRACIEAWSNRYGLLHSFDPCSRFPAWHNSATLPLPIRGSALNSNLTHNPLTPMLLGT